MWIIKLLPAASKYMAKQRRGDLRGVRKINEFIGGELAKAKDPTALANAKKLRGYKGNFWRWKVGDYRIIGEVRSGELIILVIKIGQRENFYD